jgi:GNAT superfamily N-acetyltransferase
MDPDRLRTLAHRAMVLLPSPMLRYHRDGRHEVRDGVAFNRTDWPGPSFNFAGVIGPTPPLGGVLDVAGRFFAGRSDGYGVLVEGDAGHPVEDELKARGWTVFEDEPALVMPTIPTFPPLPDELSVRHATDPAAVAEYCAVTSAAFGAPPELDGAFTPPAASLRDSDIAYLVGDCDGRPVAAGGLMREEEIAVVWGVATLEAYRGRGFGTAMTAAALQLGQEWGCTVAALRSGPMSLRLYQRMGFVTACRHRTYVPPV